jgi:hypothetical protein
MAAQRAISAHIGRGVAARRHRQRTWQRLMLLPSDSGGRHDDAGATEGRTRAMTEPVATERAQRPSDQSREREQSERADRWSVSNLAGAGAPPRGWASLFRRAAPGQRAQLMTALQRTVGNAYVVQHLVHDLVPSPTKDLQRVAMYSPAPATPPHAMTRSERRTFVTTHFTGPERRSAQRILEDIADAHDAFVFTGSAELVSELRKRMTMSTLMRETQRRARNGLRPFSYPFSREAPYWGPRVNYAAALYWTPNPPDGYSTRNNPATRAQIRHVPRGERHAIMGDPHDEYEWHLTSAGASNPYQALINLFIPQPPHMRTLIHCDYLVSLVEFRAYADQLHEARFNAAIAAFGPQNFVLRWNAFEELELPRPGTLLHPEVPGLGSLIEAHPTSEADLVVGDHVVFWNHRAYPWLNRRIGNAWKLENAVMVERRGNTDIFLGHGSGEMTEPQMRRRLMQEYNEVARLALNVVRRLQSRDAAVRTQATSELRRQFPAVERRIEWSNLGYYIILPDNAPDPSPVPLREINEAEVPGLHDPWHPERLNTVRRPAEARP